MARTTYSAVGGDSGREVTTSALRLLRRAYRFEDDATTMTIAERYAELYDNNGRLFYKGERSLTEDCERESIHTSSRGGAVRYKFSDDSTIVVTDGGWDIGYTHCFCWREEGHNDDCWNKLEE